MLLTAHEVAQQLRVPVPYVYALSRRGEIPTVRLGERKVRYRPEAIAQWLEQIETTRPKGSQ